MQLDLTILQRDSDSSLQSRTDASNVGLGGLRPPADPVDRMRLLDSLERRLFSSSAKKEPLRLGRYALGDVLGAGGMGVVYGAEDHELGRSVAIKLIQTDSGRGQERAERRMRLEARTLARLSHGNIVQIYDVGTFDLSEIGAAARGRLHSGGVFIVMQLVVGKNLQEWIRATPRTVSQIIETFVAAGRGLAAAHAAGVVHRDFKPGNVMVGDNGRVRVLDFGLARVFGLGPDESDMAITLATGEQPPADSACLTRTGELAGTPAYMAPEVIRGQSADEQSDQFAFCVSLFEALCGRRPFVGESLQELQSTILQGKVRWPSTVRGVPRRVRAAILRGLSIRPEARFASMEDLLDALVPPKSGALGWCVALAAGAAVVAYGVMDQATSCRVPTGLESVWNRGASAGMGEAFVQTQAPYGRTAAKQVDKEIDAYVASWTRAADQVCSERTRQTQAVRDHQAAMTGCLEQARAELSALVDAFQTADPALVERAADAVRSLPSPTSCGDTVAVGPQIADPEQARQVAAFREQLAKSRALHLAGRYPQALAIADPIVEAVADVDYPPVRAEALVRRGTTRELMGKLSGAVADLTKAYFVALEGDDYELAREAATRLVFLHGHRTMDTDAAERWTKHARAALAREGLGEDSAAAARLDTHYAAALARQGKLDQARVTYERALATSEATMGARHPTVATICNNLATIYDDLDRDDEAAALFKRALAIVSATSGPRHPRVAAVLNNLGNLEDQRGRFDEAAQYYARALAIRRAAFGDQHEAVGEALFNLGQTRVRQGNTDEGLVHLERALEIRRSELGDDHPDVAAVVEATGEAMSKLGDPDGALARFEETLEIREKAFGASDPAVAVSLNKIASVRRGRGELEQALSASARAVQIIEDKLGHDDPQLIEFLENRGQTYRRLHRLEQAREDLARAVAISMRRFGAEDNRTAGVVESLGFVLAEQGRPGDAIAKFEQALMIRMGNGAGRGALARARFGLAQILIELDPESVRAVELARQARAGFSELGDLHKARELVRWLGAHSVG